MKVVYVFSGKGGVGKSTVCVNLAFAFHMLGFKTALFDADISGPSIPTLVKGLEESKPRIDGVSVLPGIYGGIAINSLGFICEPTDGSFWIGKYLQGALFQLAFSVPWDAEVLLVDLPPGVSDIHQELFTKMPGKILIVTTPQRVAFSDILRSVDFVKRLNIETLGVVENMSYYECEECGHRKRIFTSDTQSGLCDPLGVNMLAELPIIPEINELSDVGIPFVCNYPHSSPAEVYKNLAGTIWEQYDL